MKRLVVQMVTASGADFVKTSTGFGPTVATIEDVALLREEAPEGLAVKASGGIRTLEEALGLLNAGASRLGASSSVGIIREARSEEHTSELQSRQYLVCRLLLEKKKKTHYTYSRAV